MIPEVSSLTREEKFLMMRDLWEDMRNDISAGPETPEIIELLSQREARIESGEAELLDWDDVKGSIGRS